MLGRYLCIALLMWAGTASACDVCGCAVSSGGIGLLPQTAHNYIGMQWSQTSFSASAGAGEHHSSAEDRFHRIDLFGRYVLNSKWQLIGVIPYQYNIRKGEQTASYDLKGLGDARFMVNYVPWSTLDAVEANWRFKWEVSAGVKFATGKYQTEVEQGDLPNNFSLGTGSRDYLFNTTLSINHKDFGLTTQFSYRLNTANSEDYLFGNQLTANSYLFWNKPISTTTSLVPYVGLAFEQIAKDRLDSRFNVAGTGGYGWMVATGLDVQMLSWTFRLACQIPYYQHFADGDVEGKFRYSATVAYLF